MLKIDIHTHILPERWPDLRERFGYGGWPRLDHHAPCKARMMIDDRFFRDLDINCWDSHTRIRECEAGGVAVQVLSTLPVMFSYWARPADALDLSRILNDHIADIAREHPRCFVGLGTIPLQDPQVACHEMERCVRDLGMSGVQIGSHVDANEYTGRREVWNLNARELDPFYATAESLGAAIFVHPWDMMGKERMPKYWLPWLVGMPAETSLAICSMIFGGVFERFPRLRVAFAHGGGSFPFTIGRIAHGFQARPDLCAIDNQVHPRDYLRQYDGTPARFYLDSLVHDPEALRYIIRLMGEERIMLGSDYPFPLGEPVAGALIDAMDDLPAATKKQLLSGTALEFLNLDQARFK